MYSEDGTQVQAGTAGYGAKTERASGSRDVPTAVSVIEAVMSWLTVTAAALCLSLAIYVALGGPWRHSALTSEAASLLFLGAVLAVRWGLTDVLAPDTSASCTPIPTAARAARVRHGQRVGRPTATGARSAFRRTLRCVGLHVMPRRGDIVWAAALTLMWWVVTRALRPVFAHSWTHQAAGDERAQQMTTGGIVGVLLMSYICTGLFEELAFRGPLVALARTLKPRVTTYLVLAAGTVLTTATFAAWHAEFSAWNTAQAGVVGLASALVGIRRRSIWASVLAHGTWNTYVGLTFLLTARH